MVKMAVNQEPWSITLYVTSDGMCGLPQSQSPETKKNGKAKISSRFKNMTRPSLLGRGWLRPEPQGSPTVAQERPEGTLRAFLFKNRNCRWAESHTVVWQRHRSVWGKISNPDSLFLTGLSFPSKMVPPSGKMSGWDQIVCCKSENGIQQKSK